jgi:hypothetical protein
MNLKQSLQIGAALAKLGPMLMSVVTQVIAAIPGGITADEAEKIATQALADEDLKIMVKGVDIIDPETQEALLTVVARIARNVVSAVA